MISNLQSNAEIFLANLERIQQRNLRAQQQITSGLKVASASDAPDQIGNILQLRSDLQRSDQIHTNLVRMQGEVNTAESVLQNAVLVIERAIKVASQGAGTTVTAGQRTSLSIEAGALHEQLVGMSRTTVQGRFLFSGDQDQLPSYSIDLAAPNGVTRLITPAATRLIEDSSGVTFSVSRTAQQIFDLRNPDDSLATNNAFAAVNGLRIALAANDQVGIETALGTLRQVNDYLNTQLSYYGGVQNRLSQAVTRVESVKIQLKTDLAGREEADVVAASIELNQSETHLNAAMAARARMPRTSLFDFLG
jgi:flagellar hook-associated protein 3 FlgL